MKLSEGDEIKVTSGLPGTKAGVYWIDYISYCHGEPYYGLRKFYGRSISGRFFSNTIDALMAQGKMQRA